VRTVLKCQLIGGTGACRKVTIFAQYAAFHQIPTTVAAGFLVGIADAEMASRETVGKCRDNRLRMRPGRIKLHIGSFAVMTNSQPEMHGIPFGSPMVETPFLWRI